MNGKVNAVTLGLANLYTNKVASKLSEEKADKKDIPEPYTLPTASADTKGGVKVGEGLQMTGEALEVKPEEYELIETITLEEDTVRIDRTAEPDGTPYKFSAVKVYGKNVGLTEGKNYSYGVYVRDYIIGAAGYLKTLNGNYFCATIANENGLWNRIFVAQNNDAWSASQYAYIGQTRVSETEYPYITELTIRQLNAVASTAGSIFEIWGVRADA